MEAVRVITYIDGFNLYFGLKSSGWRKYYWLNLYQLSMRLLKSNQRMVFVKYYTSRIAAPASKHKRQTTYLEALETMPNFSITYGKYQHNPHTCPNCGHIETIPNEKMTDVNIAVEMLGDAYENKYDTALLISADSDLTAPIKKILSLYKNKRIVAVFPPNRASKEIMKVASAYFTLGRAHLAASLFPEEVKTANGYVLKCPDKWK
jgi:uncharacterized LabA/DUF88 family protein